MLWLKQSTMPQLRPCAPSTHSFSKKEITNMLWLKGRGAFQVTIKWWYKSPHEIFRMTIRGQLHCHLGSRKGMNWSETHLVGSSSLWSHGLYPTRLLCPWYFPGKNTGIGCHFLLQGIFPTQGLNLGLLHCRQDSLLSQLPGKRDKPH